jgi:site-specific recombinase XerD
MEVQMEILPAEVVPDGRSESRVAVHADVAAARDFMLAEISDATKRAYRNDWAVFVGWCARNGIEPLGASAEALSAYLASEATGGSKSSTIGRRAAAIAYAFRLAGFENPVKKPMVGATLKGIRRKLGTAPEQKEAATAERVTRMLEAMPDQGMKALRDRALLLLGFAGAFRRSELVALDAEDVVIDSDGARVMIRISKTDQEGTGQEIAIPRGSRLRPVDALEAWLAAAKIVDGPIFRVVHKTGTVLARRLSDQVVALLVKEYAERAGLDPAL